MFKKILALLLATMMVLGGMVTVAAEEAEAPVEEVVDTVDYDAIYAASADKLAALDILKGNGVDYALDDYVQRWHMALFVARIMSGETKDEFWNEVADNTTKFDDVDNYFGAIDYVSERGIVKGKGWIPGVGSNCFAPNESIILQDALTMVVRALGYKQLENYPDDFVAKAEALGLTAGLEELDLTAPLTRGQMVQILTNTLFTEIDGTSFAKANFGLEEQTYVIVATEYQALVGANKVNRVDYDNLDAYSKYVALAPKNVDGTYDFANIVYFTEAELGLDYDESEQKLGYSYVVTSFNGFETISGIDAIEPDMYYNYNDEIEIAAGSKYSAYADPAIVKIGDNTYRLVETYTELTNKPTYTNKQPEIIVHSMFEDETKVAEYSFLYDLQGNILDPQNVTEDGTLRVAIFYTAWNNTYYVKEEGGYRIATEDDFAKYAIGAKAVAPQYGTTTTATDLTTIKFSEIAMFDDDDDGDYDRGIYVPYSIGQYRNDTKAKKYVKDDQPIKYNVLLDDITGKVDNSKDQYYVTIGGAAVNGQYYGSNGLQNFDKLNADAINFEGEKVSNKDYIIYNYNPYSRVMTVIENLGQPKTGTLEAFKQETVKLDGGKFVVDKAATVTIDGVVYELGYVDTTINNQFDKKFTTIDNKVNVAVADAKQDYLTLVYNILIKSRDKQVSYLTLDGKVIKLASVADITPYSEWIVFDYGVSEEKNTTLGYKTYSYTGDVIDVDDEGFIIVNGYDSAYKTGDRVDIKIDKINGHSFGLLVEDYAILQYQFSGVGFITDANALETMKKIVVKNFFTTLTADLNTDKDGKPTDTNYRQYMFRVENVNDDGSYDINTDVKLYWPAATTITTAQPKPVADLDTMITFQEGISSDYSTKKDTVARLFMDKDSTIVIAGTDGIKTFKGIPNNGAVLNLPANAVFAFSNDLILIVSKTLSSAQIYDAKNSVALEGLGWTYYLVTDATSVALSDDYKVFTYKNLYNINTGAAATVVVKDGLTSYNKYDPTATIFGADYAALVTTKPLGAIYANKGNEWKMLTDATKLEKVTSYVFSADDSAVVLDKLLYAGFGIYAPVYDNADMVLGASDYDQMIKLASGNKYDATVKFATDIITYTVTDDVVTKVTLADNTAATKLKAGAIYYDYAKYKSYAGLIIAGATGYTDIEIPTPVLPTLAETQDAAKKAINDAAGTEYASIAAPYITKIDAALTVAEVEALKDAALKAITAEKDADASDLATAVKDAKAALDAAYDNRSDVADAKAFYDAHIAELDAATITVARAVEIKVYGPGLLADIIKAYDDAQAAIPTCKMENDGAETVITMTNIPSTANWLYVYAEGDIAGLWTENVIKVHLASDAVTVPADPTAPVVADWVRNGDDATISIKYADGFQNSKNVLEAGTYYVVITHDGAADQVFEKVVLG